MIPPLNNGIKSARRLLRCQKGQALVETALVAPILLMIVLGLIESGNGLSIKHKMAVLSREGANITARGTDPTETLNVMMLNGDEINLSEQGGVIVTRVVVRGGDPVVDVRVSHAGFGNSSRLWNPSASDSVVAALQSLSLVEGQVFNVVEIIYHYEPMTPIGNFLPDGWTDEVYEKAIF